MPLPLALAPAASVLLAVCIFLIIRWWIGRSGAAVFFTLSVLLNLTLLVPVALAVAVVQEVQDFQEKMPVTQKLIVVERGRDVLLAASFTDVKDLEKGFSSFKTLNKEEIQRMTASAGNARYTSGQTYYKAFVVKREFLEKLAASARPVGYTPQAQQNPQAGQRDASLQTALSSIRDALQSGDMDKASRAAADLQKAYRDRGMGDAADLARQVEQAARAKDASALAALGPRIAQMAASNAMMAMGPASLLSGTPISGDVLLKIVDAEDPAKLLAPYLPQQVIQDIGGGDPARLKLLVIAYLAQNRFQTGFDPFFVLSEYRSGNIQIYPETSVSALVKLLPLDLPARLLGL